MDIKASFRNAQISETVSFTLFGGEVVSGKVVAKVSKRGRNGGTVLSVQTTDGLRDFSFRDCSLESVGVTKVQTSSTEVKVEKESVAERIARITRSVNVKLGVSTPEAKIEPRVVAAPKVQETNALLTPVDPSKFTIPVWESAYPEMFLFGLLGDETDYLVVSL